MLVVALALIILVATAAVVIRDVHGPTPPGVDESITEGRSNDESLVDASTQAIDMAALTLNEPSELDLIDAPTEAMQIPSIATAPAPTHQQSTIVPIGTPRLLP